MTAGGVVTAGGKHDSWRLQMTAGLEACRAPVPSRMWLCRVCRSRKACCMAFSRTSQSTAKLSFISRHSSLALGGQMPLSSRATFSSGASAWNSGWNTYFCKTQDEISKLRVRCNCSTHDKWWKLVGQERVTTLLCSCAGSKS